MFRKQDGFTLIEVLVALTLVLFALLLSASLLWQQPRLVERLEAQRRALRALEATLESLRAERSSFIMAGELVWPEAVPPPDAVEGFEVFIDMTPTEVPNLYDVTVEVRYEVQRQGVRRRLQSKIWRLP